MTDRIANPWGERTPFGRGEDWPVRVDQFLEDGVSEEEMDRWVQTASILHSNGDALDIAVKDDRIVGVRGRAVDRVNKGRVDPKDLYGWQANSSEDRLTRPLVRDENGELVEASWDENPPKLIVVDPRPTLPAQRADVHLAVKNGTNMALMNALLHEVIANGWYDEEYVEAHTIGFESLKNTVEQYPPERAAEICGVEAEDIREAARLIGNSERLLSTALQGFYQSRQATASACQVNHIHLLRGMIGKPGCGIYHINCS